MKSTVFSLDITDPDCTCKGLVGSTYTYEFIIPTLPAFAIEFYTLQYGGLSSFPEHNDLIKDNKLTIHLDYDLSELDVKLIIHYHGIRDYELLFPFIVDSSLKKRLGLFYREAEIAFENALWFSFMLMCGAIFEGILFANFNRDSPFCSLINNAYSQNLIDEDTKTLMHIVRSYRNAIHASNHEEPFVSQIHAMDTRVKLDKLIKTWKLPANAN